ncbi:MAG: helix-turn-helix domain-containing protein [Acidimicrobiales bacterium]
MPWVRVEFTVEPFVEGVLGPHVTAALDTLRQAGFEPDVGPFGNAIHGESEQLFPALASACIAAFAAKATGLALTARAARAHSGGSEAFVIAMQPVAKAMGGRVIEVDEMEPDDVPLVWQGEVVGGMHVPAHLRDLRDGPGLLVSQVEAEIGAPLAELSRADKQRAVRRLDERGAFSLRNSVDAVADVMGVSRVTVYNYLNATRESASASDDAASEPAAKPAGGTREPASRPAERKSRSRAGRTGA